jgi:hypothetical protein
VRAVDDVAALDDSLLEHSADLYGEDVARGDAVVDPCREGGGRPGRDGRFGLAVLAEATRRGCPASPAE